MKRETMADGTVTETKSITFTERKTVHPGLATYNAAQGVEKDPYRSCSPNWSATCRARRARPRAGSRTSTPTGLFVVAFKVYMHPQHAADGIGPARSPRQVEQGERDSRLKVNKFMENPASRRSSRANHRRAALPLRRRRTRLRRSTPAGSPRAGSSALVRPQVRGRPPKEHDWVKVPSACGVKTNVVTAVRISTSDTAGLRRSSPRWSTTTAAALHHPRSLGRQGVRLVEQRGADRRDGGTAYIAFKANTTAAVGGTLAARCSTTSSSTGTSS